MTNQQLTINLQMLAGALELRDRHSISRIITLGGVECSKSRADAILRKPGATKYATGNSEIAGKRIPRSSEVSEEEFNAFCRGLIKFLDATGDQS
ncbi:hypothetical protein ACP3BQ_005251 [Klebsiella pneumoniae]